MGGPSAQVPRSAANHTRNYLRYVRSFHGAA
jgi:hypothetical protein